MLLSLLGHTVRLRTDLLRPEQERALAREWNACRIADGGGREPSGVKPGRVGTDRAEALVAGSDDGTKPADAYAAEWTVRLLPADSPDVVAHLGPRGATEAGDAGVASRERVEELALTAAAIADGYAISQRLTRVAIAHSAGELLLLHAAGLVPKRGPRRAVGIVAASGTGKTTFCLRLAEDFDYLTDETLGIEQESLRVRPYPKPLSLVQPDGRKSDGAPDVFGLTAVHVGDDPVTLGAVVIAERVPSGMSLEPVGLAEAIGEVAPQTSSLYELTDPLRTLAQALTLAGGPWRLRFSDQAECGPLLLALAAGDVGRCRGDLTSGWTHHPGPMGRGRSDAAGGKTTGDAQEEPELGEGPTKAMPDVSPEGDVFVRAPWTDAVEADGMVAILIGQRVSVLGGVGAAAWLACEMPRTFGEMHDAVVLALGEYPDSRVLLERALSSLAAQGVIHSVSRLGR